MVLLDLLRMGAKSSSSEEAVSESSDSTRSSGSCEPVFSLLSVSSELLGLVLLRLSSVGEVKGSVTSVNKSPLEIGSTLVEVVVDTEGSFLSSELSSGKSCDLLRAQRELGVASTLLKVESLEAVSTLVETSGRHLSLSHQT